MVDAQKTKVKKIKDVKKATGEKKVADSPKENSEAQAKRQKKRSDFMLKKIEAAKRKKEQAGNPDSAPAKAPAPVAPKKDAPKKEKAADGAAKKSKKSKKVKVVLGAPQKNFRSKKEFLTYKIEEKKALKKALGDGSMSSEQFKEMKAKKVKDSKKKNAASAFKSDSEKILKISFKGLPATRVKALKKKAKKLKMKELTMVNGKADPSMTFISKPAKIPAVRDAKLFFRNNVPKEMRIEDLSVTCGPAFGWRTQSKLAVRKAAKEGDAPQIGLFLPGTHEVIPSRNCPAHHPSINKAIQIIESTCVEAGVQGYEDASGSGDLRYVQMTVERSTGLVQLLLVWHSTKITKQLKDLANRLAASDIFHSIWGNLHAPSKYISRIVSYEENDWHHLAKSKEPIREQCKTLELPYEHPNLCFTPNVFIQSNLTGFENILTSIRKYTPQNSQVLELYGGVGTIGFHLLDKVSRLRCSDENPNNEGCFQDTRSQLDEELQSRIVYKTGDAANQISNIQRINMMIVDPPRKGLSDKVLNTLESLKGKKNGPTRVIYVSCGFKAFKRDCEKMIKADWKLSHAEVHVLFPGSDHIETMAVFDRSPPEEKSKRKKKSELREEAMANMDFDDGTEMSMDEQDFEETVSKKNKSKSWQSEDDGGDWKSALNKMKSRK